MALLKSPLERAAGALEISERRLADFERERADKLAQADASVDFDAGFMLREEVATLDRKINAAQVARDHARQQLDRAQAEAAQADADRQHAEAKKLARAGEKLTLDVAAAAERLAGLLADLEANRAAIDEANRARGRRDFIADGEHRVRAVPARKIQAVTRKEKAWVDRNGNRPSQLVMRNGEMVPAGMSGDYTYRTVEVMESPARFVPAAMPARFADEIRLVGLKGEKLWPR